MELTTQQAFSLSLALAARIEQLKSFCDVSDYAVKELAKVEELYRIFNNAAFVSVQLYSVAA